MKKLIGILIIAVSIYISGCDANRNADDNETLNETLNADTTAIDGNLNPRGLPEETIPDGSRYSGDTLIHEAPLKKADLPEDINKQIDADPNLRNREIKKSRTYTLEGQTMYELIFEGDDEIVVFDEKGGRVIRK